MENTLNNPVNNTPVQNNVPTNNPVSANSTPNTNSQSNENPEPKPINTGEQYEQTDATHPEDLDVTWVRWRCLVCNYLYEGSNPIRKCPRCGNDNPDKFEDVD